MPNQCKQIFDAIVAHDINALKLTLNSKACLEERDESGRTPLMRASLLGYDEFVAEILKHNPQLDAADDEGDNPIILAATLDRIGIIRDLVAHGSTVDGRNATTGETALMVAAHSASTACVSTLLSLGANPNAQNKHGITSLMRAVFGGNVETVRTLLQKQALIDSRDEKGRTALFHAVAKNRVEISRLLKDSGADPTLKDVDGLSPRVIAAKAQDAKMRLLFEPTS